MLRPEVSVGAVVLRDPGELLLVRRGREPGRGLWSVPGGRVEGGETLAAAVVREVREEAGIVVRCGDFLGHVERIGAEWHFVILDFLAHQVDEREPRAGDDADAVAWVSLDAVRQMDLVAGLAEFLAEHGILPD